MRIRPGGRTYKLMRLLVGALLCVVVTAVRLPAQQQDADLDGTRQQISQLYEQGHVAEALSLAQRTVEATESRYGADSLQTARSLNDLGVLCQNTGDYARAAACLERALRIVETKLGRDSRQAATSLNNLAVLYADRGDYAKALPLYERALAIDEKALGSDNPEVATNLDNLGELQQRMGHYDLALPLLQRALAIREKALGPDHPEVAVSLNSLGLLFAETGDYVRARPLYERALALDEKAFGPTHVEVATDLNNLGELYQDMGDYEMARPLMERALGIWEKALGPEHPTVATCLVNLALLYQSMGDYTRARPLYERALASRERTLGPNHPDVAITLDNLASLYQDMGDYDKAGPLMQRALAIRDKAFGPQHPDVAVSLNNLATLYRHTGDFGRARPLFERALSIRLKALGPDNPMVADSLNNLALLYEDTGEYAKARSLLERALSMHQKTFGAQHPEVATDLNNLATLDQRARDYGKARSRQERALAIMRPVLGPDHPELADLFTNLAYSDIHLQRLAEARQEARRVARIQDRALANVLSFTSESERLAWQAKSNPYSLAATLGDAGAVAQAVLRNKGIVLDSLTEDTRLAQASHQATVLQAVQDLTGRKRQLQRLLLERPADVTPTGLAHRAQQQALMEQDVEHREGELARTIAGLGETRSALKVTVADVQHVLPPGAVLVECLRYGYYPGAGRVVPRYAAVIIPAHGPPALASLGDAASLDADIKRYQRSVRLPDSATDPQLAAQLRSLYQRIWQPMAAHLPAGTHTIIISPDGELSFLSFATLMGPDNHFLAESCDLRYVASGRDLLRPTAAPLTSPPHLTLFANPDFQAGSPEAGQGIRVPPLPGTQQEADRLEALARRHGWPCQVFTGLAADKNQLQTLEPTDILHLATHGFFLPEPVHPAAHLPNPMTRSGLALAGAQATLDAWTGGAARTGENNGIMTAAEVSLLNLARTWLVVLSACDTGSGEALAGEGVLGLRRGFVQAGARNLLMTLWPIADADTTAIMVDFYEAAARSKNPPQALADVQRAWLVKLRQDGLSRAVTVAGPFILTFQGRPR